MVLSKCSGKYHHAYINTRSIKFEIKLTTLVFCVCMIVVCLFPLFLLVIELSVLLLLVIELSDYHFRIFKLFLKVTPAKFNQTYDYYV